MAPCGTSACCCYYSDSTWFHSLSPDRCVIRNSKSKSNWSGSAAEVWTTCSRTSDGVRTNTGGRTGVDGQQSAASEFNRWKEICRWWFLQRIFPSCPNRKLGVVSVYLSLSPACVAFQVSRVLLLLGLSTLLHAAADATPKQRKGMRVNLALDTLARPETPGRAASFHSFLANTSLSPWTYTWGLAEDCDIPVRLRMKGNRLKIRFRFLCQGVFERVSVSE